MSHPDLPGNWDIAGYGEGWGEGDNWHNVEAGAPYPSNEDLQDADYIVVRYTYDDGSANHFTIPFGFEDWDDLSAYIEEYLDDRYGEPG